MRTFDAKFEKKEFIRRILRMCRPIDWELNGRSPVHLYFQIIVWKSRWIKNINTQRIFCTNKTLIQISQLVTTCAAKVLFLLGDFKQEIVRVVTEKDDLKSQSSSKLLSTFWIFVTIGFLMQWKKITSSDISSMVKFGVFKWDLYGKS